MFDANSFKRSVKEWMRSHPEGTEADLVDFCEDQIPAAQFAANQWLVEHTLSWYKHVLTQRRLARGLADEADEESAA
jgi:hypothetical protein